MGYLSKNFKILIADDNRDFAAMLSQNISLYPDMSIVGIASNGMDVMNMLQRHKPDIVLLDIIMPDMDGMEVLRQICEMEGGPTVFMLSILCNESVVNQSIRLGAKFLLKPIDAGSIVLKIRSLDN